MAFVILTWYWVWVSFIISQFFLLDPLLFDIFVAIQIIEKSNSTYFAVANMFFSCANDFTVILSNIAHDINILLDWFNINSLKLNLGSFNT